MNGDSGSLTPDDRIDRLEAANERVRQASKRVGEANHELYEAERERRLAWEALKELDPNA